MILVGFNGILDDFSGIQWDFKMILVGFDGILDDFSGIQWDFRWF